MTTPLARTFCCTSLSLLVSTCFAFAAVPGLVASYELNNSTSDATGNHNGNNHGASPTFNRFGTRDQAMFFDGDVTTAYIEIPDSNVFSITNTGALTVAGWMRPEILTFPHDDGVNGYVYWMGKGTHLNQQPDPNQEWAFRMYNTMNHEEPMRPNWLSVYVFNPIGGKGNGSRYEYSAKLGTWYYVIGVFDLTGNSTKIYVNGTCRDADKLTAQGDPPNIVTPADGDSPVRIGTEDLTSFFRGAIDDVQMYDRALSDSEIQNLYGAQNWNNTGSGSWSMEANWASLTVPNSGTAFARFHGVPTAICKPDQNTSPRTIALDGDKTVGALDFENPSTYTITQGFGGTLTIGNGSTGTLHVGSGSHVISAPLILSGNILMSGQGNLNIKGPFTIAPQKTVTKRHSGTLTISGPQSHGAGSKMDITSGFLNVNSNAGSPSTLSTGALANLGLSVTLNGRILLGANQDLHDLDVVTSDANSQSFDLNSPSSPSAFRSVRIYPSDLAAAKTSLYAAIRNANAPGAADPTDGIFDSGLASHVNSRLGLARLADAHGDEMILIRPTRIGDLNLDGNVTISDFIDLAAHFNQPGAWQEGDLNYDGQVTISDFIDLAGNFNTSYSGDEVPISTEDQQALNEFTAWVPEPALTVMAFPFAPLFLPRRKKPSGLLH